MCNLKNLSEINLNQTYIISKINCDPKMRKRLLDLSISPNSKITPILESPTKGIRAYSIRGTILAIRDSDAQYITVEVPKNE